MHFVFISSLVPVAAPASGFDIANRVIVDAVRLLGHRVSVIGFLQPRHKPAAPDDTRTLGQLEVTNARVSKWQKALWLKDAFVHGEPVSVGKMHAASPADVRSALDGLGKIDGLLLNSVQLPGAFLKIFKHWPCIFIAHNAEAKTAAHNAQTARNPLTRFLFARDERLLARLERNLCTASSFVFTLADADRKGLGLTADTPSTTLPLVTSVTPPAGPVSRKTVYDAGMIGSWTWTANRAGLDWFLAEVVPLLPQDFRIAIAGDTGADKPAAEGNVSFLGRVPDAREFVRSCSVIPLVSRTGTGVQLKTIETFEMGLPSVATGNALRGIARPPANCIHADDPQTFAAALIDQVVRARSGEALDSDGRIFHQQQLSGLGAALVKGFEGLGQQG